MKQEVCLAQITNQYETLSKIERKAADYILANSEAVIGMNVAELAGQAQVAGSAVIRFCKKLGYSGYTEFRMALTQELARRTEKVMPILEGSGTAAQTVNRVFASGIRTLQNTLAMLDCGRLEALADALEGAKRVCLFGVGTSSAVAEDIAYRLLQLGIPAASYTDILFMPVAARNLEQGDVAIAVSHSGRTAATVQALCLARRQGARTAAVTSYQSSPLAQEAELVLVAYPDDVNYPVEAVSARLAHSCIFDALTAILTLRGGDEALERLRTRNDILEKIRKEESK